MKNLQAIRGMNDILPADIEVWQQVEQVLRGVCHSFAYQEIRTPVLETTSLFKRSIGEVTDIVEKEMYTFTDRNGDSLSMRPEGTASCVRAGIQHGLFYNQLQQLWYLGPMYRHERPQKGRYRQFHQFGIEAIGFQHAEKDAEVIQFAAEVFQRLALLPKLELQINSLGTGNCRLRYKAALVDYFSQHRDSLDEDSLRRLTSNPLRILDSKNPSMKPLIDDAPSMHDYLSDEAQNHFMRLQTLLKIMQIPFTINPRLVRGLDYYTHTVFEWVSGDIGAQSAVCSGGRYDGLVEQLGGKSCPAVGFALGMERLIDIVNQSRSPQKPQLDIYCVHQGDEAMQKSFAMAGELRQQFPQLSVLCHHETASLKSQFKKANKANATLAIIIGEDEISQGVVQIKWLKESREQQVVAFSDLPKIIKNQLA